MGWFERLQSTAPALKEGGEIVEGRVRWLIPSGVQRFEIFLPISAGDRVHSIGGEQQEPVVPALNRAVERS